MTTEQALIREWCDKGEQTVLCALRDLYLEEGQEELAEKARFLVEYDEGEGPGCQGFMFSCGELCSTYEELVKEGCERCSKWAAKRIWAEILVADLHKRVGF